MMPDDNQTTQDANTPLQHPPRLTGNSTMLISLFLGLPIVSVVIFGTGLWLGYKWYSPPSLSPSVPPDASLAADRESLTHHPVDAALDQQAPALSLTLPTVPPSRSTPAYRDAKETNGHAPKSPSPVTTIMSGDKSVAPQQSTQFQEVVVASTLVLPSPSTIPSGSLSSQFEPDVEGWNTIKDSMIPLDFVEFLEAFPRSRFAAAARTRLRQLQCQPPPSSSDDMREPVRPGTPEPRGVPSSVLLSVTRMQVRYAQISLRLAGFDPGPIDGMCGVQTLDALRQYQESRDIPVTGMLDTATQQALQIPSYTVLEAWQQSRRTGHASPGMAEPSHQRAPQAKRQHGPSGSGPHVPSEF